MSQSYPLFVKRDIDGFFGLFIDNLVQFLAILALCSNPFICGMNGENSFYLFRYIFPGAAVSILFGNLFYAWQARRLAARENRNDVTALPYGINTPSMLVYIFFVMAPVYARTQSVEAAWKMGLIACFGSGVIEFVCSFFAEFIRKHTPRAALLSTLAGIAIGFIAMTFTLQIFHKPLIAMVPLGLILIALFSKSRFPLGLPGGLLAVLAGTTVAWGLTVIVPHLENPPIWITNSVMDPAVVTTQFESLSWYPPVFIGQELWMLLQDWKQWVGYLSVIVPMGLFNVIGSLQNIESAQAGGDRYATAPSMMVNGIGTMLAALFGSCFPTTIYIGHPGWKALGSRAGYSTINGIVITLICFSGMIGLASSIIPIEAGVAIVLWIGVIITAQAFQATEHHHAPAVAIGLFPAIAAWGATIMYGSFFTAGGKSLQELLVENANADVNGFLVGSLISMERGYIFTCMILAAISACLIDRKFFVAGIWSLIAAVFTFCGLMHSFQLSGNNVDYLMPFAESAEGAYLFSAYGIGIGYVGITTVCWASGAFLQKNDSSDDVI